MDLRIFSTCPQSADFDNHSQYINRVTDVARWSEAHGCEGILVYTDNRLLDPWLVSDLILRTTKRLCPLIAVQPIYVHPYSVAKILSSYAYLYSRRVYLNMVAGGFSNDLTALGDATAHDRRYDRLTEYTEIIQRLCRNETVTLNGEFYQVNALKLQPSFAAELLPGILMSGSSEAGLAVARRLGALAVRYPMPADQEQNMPESEQSGIRVGIVARESDDEAWDIAERRFPEERKGQIAHQFAMRTSDSVWHKQLSALADMNDAAKRNPYWMRPFQNYKTFCPYLVGSYEGVGSELARYVRIGYRTFILDIPAEEEELRHTAEAFRFAQRLDTKERAA
jgi:alkanesulfonate monooxygenase